MYLNFNFFSILVFKILINQNETTIRYNNVNYSEYAIDLRQSSVILLYLL